MVTALAVLSAVLALTLAGLAAARMQSTKLRPGLCETTGGGRFVDIPGFPGETIDRRLLTDIRRLVRRYKIFVTDGYSQSDVHAANGEHPLGLALDIVPDKERAAPGTGSTASRPGPSPSRANHAPRFAGWATTATRTTAAAITSTSPGATR